jgi:hypothetical protein
MIILAQVFLSISLVLLAVPVAVYRRIQAPSFWLFLAASFLSGITWLLATYDLGFYIPEIIAEMFVNGEFVRELHTRQIFILDAAIPLIFCMIFIAVGLYYLVKKERQTYLKLID